MFIFIVVCNILFVDSVKNLKISEKYGVLPTLNGIIHNYYL